MKKYNTIVFIGRFQPPHKAHIETIRNGLKLADQVLVLVGSAYQPRSPKNPFYWEERGNLLRASLTKEENSNVKIDGIADSLYNHQQWLREVQEAVDYTVYKDDKIAIIGHDKDHSSFYLKMFPQWELVEMENIEDIHSTDIRNEFFSNTHRFEALVKDKVDPAIINGLNLFRETPEYAILAEEHKYLKEYKASWASAPYPPTFNTVDAVVLQSGHILLIKRKVAPGKGLWALPGGFLNLTETLLDACIRELREETKLKVPVPVLKGSVRKSHTFDSPDRSERGRTITHTFLIELDDRQELPRVKGNDDAEEAKWIPLYTFYQLKETMFEDHHCIVRHMIDNE